MNNDIATLIKRLIKEHKIEDESLDNSTLSNAINSLAEYVAKEYTSGQYFLGHSPIFQEDFTGNSEFKELNKKIDLDNVSTDYIEQPLGRDTYIQEILDNIENKNLWNYSMNELVKEYKENFKDDNKIPGSTVQVSDNYTLKDIKRANAGRRFADGPQWVRPEKDNMGELYQDVRGDDKIEAVLKSSKNLQFTRKDTDSEGNPYNYFIRLIMPKYTRRVEVEDLNRNFWVIGQTLSGVAAYLFDDESPIKKFMKYSLSELIQLWENVIYLWAAVELLNEKEQEAPEPELITDVHCEVIDYPRAKDKPSRDIHSFVEVPEFEYKDTGTNIIKDPLRLLSYKQMYPKTNLCFLLRCRQGNYEKDYYHTEVYPYIVIYDANNKEWRAINLLYRDSNGTKKVGFTLRIDSDKKGYDYINLRNEVMAMRESQATACVYYHYQDLKDLPPQLMYITEDAQTYDPKYMITPMEKPAGRYGENQEHIFDGLGHEYYSIVQIQPAIEANFNNNKIVLTKISFTFKDISQKLFYDGNNVAKIKETERGKDQDHINDYSCTVTYFDGTLTDKQQIEVNQTDFGNKIKFNKPSEGTDGQGKFSYDHRRDDGFQGSLCDMITYRGVTQAYSSSNG